MVETTSMKNLPANVDVTLASHKWAGTSEERELFKSKYSVINQYKRHKLDCGPDHVGSCYWKKWNLKLSPFTVGKSAHISAVISLFANIQIRHLDVS